MKVFLAPTGLHSRAMIRVAKALAQYAPSDISISQAITHTHYDLQILHVINQDAIPYARAIRERGGKYAVIQYCFRTAGGDLRDWLEMWRGAEVVWTYLHDVKVLIERYPCALGPEGWREGAAGIKLYYAPLGVDEPFQAMSQLLSTPGNWPARALRVITTGYVNGDGAEPIHAVWKAAELARIDGVHIGPQEVEGMPEYPRTWRTERPSDMRLAEIYATSTWVSGLRHVEGFELPAAEGLVCGARPIVFDQPGMREWYGEHAVFIDEWSGEAERGESGTNNRDWLVRRILNALTSVLPGVTAKEREDALSRFDWERIAKGFWEALLR